MFSAQPQILTPIFVPKLHLCWIQLFLAGPSSNTRCSQEIHQLCLWYKGVHANGHVSCWLRKSSSTLPERVEAKAQQGTSSRKRTLISRCWYARLCQFVSSSLVGDWNCLCLGRLMQLSLYNPYLFDCYLMIVMVAVMQLSLLHLIMLLLLLFRWYNDHGCSYD